MRKLGSRGWLKIAAIVWMVVAAPAGALVSHYFQPVGITTAQQNALCPRETLTSEQQTALDRMLELLPPGTLIDVPGSRVILPSGQLLNLGGDTPYPYYRDLINLEVATAIASVKITGRLPVRRWKSCESYWTRLLYGRHEYFPSQLDGSVVP